MDPRKPEQFWKIVNKEKNLPVKVLCSQYVGKVVHKRSQMRKYSKNLKRDMVRNP